MTATAFWRFPIPVRIRLVPRFSYVPRDAPKGTIVCRVFVRTSNGSPFEGTLLIRGRAMAMLQIVGTNVVLARNLTPADDGTFQFSVQASQNGVTVMASGTLTVVAVAVPTAVSLTPSTPSLPDNSVSGAMVSAVSVTMSDGSAFAGTLTVTGPA